MKVLLLVVGLLAATHLWGRITPAPGSCINYRLIGFSDDSLAAKGQYTLQIALGYQPDGSALQQHIAISQNFSGNRTIALVPRFGAQYTWRIVARDAPNSTEPLHYFTVGKTRYTDTNSYRMNVVNKGVSAPVAAVFVDGRGILYDAYGAPLWYLPFIDSTEILGNDLRDLKISPAGTITLLYKNIPYEIDWNGHIQWKGPNDGAVSGDTTEGYHHEFCRLTNGHYMVAGNERVIPETGGPIRLSFGTVVEYNAEGKVVWQWRSSKVYRNTHYPCSGLPGEPYDIHQNAFCFDEAHKFLYVGFKNISQIIKIKYPEGTTVATFGRNTTKGDNSPFYQQHSISLNSAGHLCVYDNHNVDNTPCRFHPLVLVMDKRTGKQLWAYEYQSRHKMKELPNMILTYGGNATQLSGNRYFVSMCAPYANFFVVNQQKQLLWEAIPEDWEAATQTWKGKSPYRASVIPNRAQLEQAIWHHQ